MKIKIRDSYEFGRGRDQAKGMHVRISKKDKRKSAYYL